CEPRWETRPATPQGRRHDAYRLHLVVERLAIDELHLRPRLEVRGRGLDENRTAQPVTRGAVYGAKAFGEAAGPRLELDEVPPETPGAFDRDGGEGVRRPLF